MKKEQREVDMEVLSEILEASQFGEETKWEKETQLKKVLQLVVCSCDPHVQTFYHHIRQEIADFITALAGKSSFSHVYNKATLRAFCRTDMDDEGVPLTTAYQKPGYGDTSDEIDSTEVVQSNLIARKNKRTRGYDHAKDLVKSMIRTVETAVEIMEVVINNEKADWVKIRNSYYLESDFANRLRGQSSSNQEKVKTCQVPEVAATIVHHIFMNLVEISIKTTNIIEAEKLLRDNHKFKIYPCPTIREDTNVISYKNLEDGVFPMVKDLTPTKLTRNWQTNKILLSNLMIPSSLEWEEILGSEQEVGSKKDLVEAAYELIDRLSMMRHVPFSSKEQAAFQRLMVILNRVNMVETERRNKWIRLRQKIDKLVNDKYSWNTLIDAPGDNYAYNIDWYLELTRRCSTKAVIKEFVMDNYCSKAAKDFDELSSSSSIVDVASDDDGSSGSDKSNISRVSSRMANLSIQGSSDDSAQVSEMDQNPDAEATRGTIIPEDDASDPEDQDETKYYEVEQSFQEWQRNRL